MKRNVQVRVLAVLAVMTATSGASATETARVGGGGGDQTVDMSCGSNAFIVGVVASGGKDQPFGMNLLRKIRFRCQAFTGTTPGANQPDTAQASAGDSATSNTSSDEGSCTSGRVVTNLELYAASFIDRLQSFECQTASASQSHIEMNVGGEGGSRQFIACPQGEALYKVTARKGGAIDSLKGYCRTFGGLASQPLHIEINASIRPKHSYDAPVKIMPGKSATYDFTVPQRGVNQTLKVGVTMETDLLGGGGMNPPDVKVEIIRPGGAVIASKTFNNAPAGIVHQVSVTFPVAGSWDVRLTNLKKDLGAVDVRRVSFAP